MKATVPKKIVRYSDGTEVITYATAIEVPDDCVAGYPVNADGHAVVPMLDYISARYDRCLAGSALKELLAKFWLKATGECGCDDRAREMDRQGCEWCESNIDTIVGWLREEATKRGLPFLDAAGRLLVQRAIASARRRHGKAQG
jgi:hypothetical protein